MKSIIGSFGAFVGRGISSVALQYALGICTERLFFSGFYCSNCAGDHRALVLKKGRL